MNLLLFSVGRVRFGTDADQVSQIDAYRCEEGEDLHWFHEELPCCDGSVPYASPTVLTIRTGSDPPYRVIIDRMEDIGTFGPEEIRLFPPLAEPFALRRGMWGILPLDGKLVLLLDFGRLLQEKGPDDRSMARREPEVPFR